MTDTNFRDAETRMHKTVETLAAELVKLRTGRAHPSLLEHVRVNNYGSDVPLNQVASIAATDARTLLVSPWDKNLVPAIEKAIISAGLGLNPVAAGQTIRVPLPVLTEERRRDLTKIVKQEAESARVAIRNIRRDANNLLKEALKNKQITEDELRRSEEKMQKLTDKFIADVDKVAAHKEAELLEV